MNNRIIEAVCQRLLVESGDQVEDLALFVDDEGSTAPTLVLYDVAALKAALKGVKKTKKSPEGYLDAAKKSIVGFMELGVTYGGRPNKAIEVQGSWVREKGKGYGKKMYGLAMAVAPSNTIMSDRTQVSPEAQRMWLSFTNDARITRKPIDNRWHPAKGEDEFHDAHHTSDKSDDGLTFGPDSEALSGDDLGTKIDALNHTAESTAWVEELNELQLRHANAVEELGVPRADLESSLLTAARNQFGSSID